MLDKAAGTSDWKLLCDMVRLMGIYSDCEGGKAYVGPGAAALAYKHLILEYVLRLELVHRYDWFIITHADHLHLCPLGPTSLLDSSKVYIPEGERFGGYSDRLMYVPARYIIQVLNVTSAFFGEWQLVLDDILQPQSSRRVYNVEIIHMLYFQRIQLPLERFQPTAFAVRRLHDVSSDYEGKRLALDNFTNNFGLLVKHKLEYKQARRACHPTALGELRQLTAKLME